MKETPAIPWTLALLDDGLRLYRRNLVSFLLVGSAILVPVAVLDLLISSFVSGYLGEDWVALGGAFRLLILYPILLYASAALSRATVMALDSTPIRVGEALRIGVGRTLAMGCYNILFSIITSIFFSIFGLLVVCPLLYGSLFGAGFLGAVGGSGTLGAAGGLFGVLFVVGILAYFIITGAQLVSMIYAVQAFVLERRSLGDTLGRSVDLLTFRFGHNFLAFLGAGAIITTLLIAYAGALLAGGAALLGFLDIELSPLATNAVSVITTTASSVLLLPPVSIWMAILHQTVAKERDAADLVSTVEQWRNAFEG